MTDKPAFPITEASPYHGMTMRQYYKSLAMQGELASQSSDIGEYSEETFSTLAKIAGQIADAMIAEDEEHKNKYCGNCGEDIPKEECPVCNGSG